MRYLILDMDGTIADTYHYPDWIGILRGHVEDPWHKCGEVDIQEVYEMFLNLKPIVPMKDLQDFCSGWDRVVVWTMTPWDATSQVAEAVTWAKLLWLSGHYPFLTDNIIVTHHQDNKNIIPDNAICHRLEDPLWMPGKDDTLCDDDEGLRDNFIGHSMSPPWV